MGTELERRLEKSIEKMGSNIIEKVELILKANNSAIFLEVSQLIQTRIGPQSERIIVVEQKVASAHKRLDEITKKTSSTSIKRPEIIKLGVPIAGAGSAVFTLIYWIVEFLRNS